MRGLALTVFILECLGFGGLVLVAPALLVETVNGADPIAYGWVRWAGANLIAMGVGGLLMLRKPGGPAIVRTMALVASLGTVGALVFSRVRDEWDGALWFLIVLVALNAAVALGVLLPAKSSDPSSDGSSSDELGLGLDPL